MTEDAVWIPDDIDTTKPNPARIADYILGGFHNFAADRAVGDRLIEVYPDVLTTGYAGRACLRRTNQFLVAQGIDQFMDIGPGLPTAGNTHAAVHAADPDARVLYVDIDPVAVTHSRAILKDEPNVAFIRGDLRKPEEVLSNEEANDLLDFDQPLALVLFGILPIIPDDEEAYGAVHAWRKILAPGSYMVISHITFEGAPADALEQMSRIYGRSTAQNKVRSASEIRKFFEGLELVEPGLVHFPLWRPEGPDDVLLDEPGRSFNLVGVGRLPDAD